MFLKTTSIIIISSTISLSPEAEIIYLDNDYSEVAKEYMEQKNTDNKIQDINDILYKTIAEELLEMESKLTE
jgi:hypothetical protein